MPSRYYERIFTPGCYYHIYNRGAHQQRLFLDKKDYRAFLDILGYYLIYPLGLPPSLLLRQPKNKVTNLANIPSSCTLLAYALMPNHFHFMIRQEEGDQTISDLMRRLSIAYAMYFNDRYHHSGTIFQGRYKNVLVESEYYWVYLSKYIHRNPAHLQGYEPCKLEDYEYSSYRAYLGLVKEKQIWLNTSILLNRYHKNPSGEYKDFVEDGGDVGKIKFITLDVDEDQSLQGS